MSKNLLKKYVLSTVFACVAVVLCILFGTSVSSSQKQTCAAAEESSSEYTFRMSDDCYVSYMDYINGVITYTPTVYLKFDISSAMKQSYIDNNCIHKDDVYEYYTSDYLIGASKSEKDKGNYITSAMKVWTYFVVCKVEDKSVYSSTINAVKNGTNFSSREELLGSFSGWHQMYSGDYFCDYGDCINLSSFDKTAYYFAVAVQEIYHFTFDEGNFLFPSTKTFFDQGATSVESLSKSYKLTSSEFRFLDVTSNYYYCDPRVNAEERLQQATADTPDSLLLAWWAGLGDYNLLSDEVVNVCLYSYKWDEDLGRVKQVIETIEVNRLRCLSKDYIVSLLEEKGRPLSSFDVHIDFDEPRRIINDYEMKLYSDFIYAYASGFNLQYGLLGSAGQPPSLFLYVTYDFNKMQFLAKTNVSLECVDSDTGEVLDPVEHTVYLVCDYGKYNNSGTYSFRFKTKELEWHLEALEANFDYLVKDLKPEVLGNVTVKNGYDTIYLCSSSAENLLCCSFELSLSATQNNDIAIEVEYKEFSFENGQIKTTTKTDVLIDKISRSDFYKVTLDDIKECYRGEYHFKFNTCSNVLGAVKLDVKDDNGNYINYAELSGLEDLRFSSLDYGRLTVAYTYHSFIKVVDVLGNKEYSRLIQISDDTSKNSSIKCAKLLSEHEGYEVSGITSGTESLATVTAAIDETDFKNYTVNVKCAADSGDLVPIVVTYARIGDSDSSEVDDSSSTDDKADLTVGTDVKKVLLISFGSVIAVCLAGAGVLLFLNLRKAKEGKKLE